MAKKVVMVVSFVLALISIACIGVCVFNLPSITDLVWLAILLIGLSSLLACAFIYIGLLARYDIVIEYYKHNEGKNDKKDYKITF